MIGEYAGYFILYSSRYFIDGEYIFIQVVRVIMRIYSDGFMEFIFILSDNWKYHIIIGYVFMIGNNIFRHLKT